MPRHKLTGRARGRSRGRPDSAFVRRESRMEISDTEQNHSAASSRAAPGGGKQRARESSLIHKAACIQRSRVPQNVHEFLEWPEWQVGRLLELLDKLGDEKKEECIAHLKQVFSTLHITTSYSGVDFPGTALLFLVQAFRAEGVDVSHPTVHSACDIGAVQQNIL